MRFLPFGYLFGWPEFLLGILVGVILARLSQNYWPRLLKLPAKLQKQLNSLPKPDISSELKPYREQLLSHLDSMHAAAPMFDLREILVHPHILLPAPIVDPDREDDPSSTFIPVLPSLPDWNPLAAIYHSPSIPVEKLVGRGVDILITGEPGSGRTTALSYLVYHLLTTNQDNPEEKPPLPVLVHAADLNLTGSEKDVLKILLQAVQRPVSFTGFRKISALITRQIQQGEAVLLLDGLDEIPLRSQQALAAFIREIKISYPDIQVLAAGEPRQLDLYHDAGLIPAPAAPWTSHDFVQFTQRWSRAWKMHIAPRLPRRLADIDPTLINAWLQPTLTGLTPLETTLRTWSAYAGDLSSTAVHEIYQAYIRRMLSPPDQKAAEQLAIAWISDYLGDDQKLTADRDTLTELVNAGICRPGSTPNRIIFSCSAVGCFLAARALSGSGVPTQITRSQTAIGESLLRSYSGITDAADIVRARLQDEDPDLQRQLLACARWLRDARPGSTWRSAVLTGLAQVASREQHPYGLRLRAVGALVHAGEARASTLFEHMLTKQAPRTVILGALGLGGLCNEDAVSDLIMTIRNNQDPLVRQACSLALSVIGNDLALETLGRLLLQGNEQAQATAAYALPANIYEGHQMLRDGLDMKKASVRRASVFGLEHVHSGWVDRHLDHMKLEDDEWVVRNAALAVSERRSEPPLYFMPSAKTLNQLSWLISFAAGQGLGVPDGPGALEILRRAINQGTIEERSAGLEAIIWFANDEFLPEVIQYLQSDTMYLKDTAFEVLWKRALARDRSLQGGSSKHSAPHPG